MFQNFIFRYYHKLDVKDVTTSNRGGGEGEGECDYSMVFRPYTTPPFTPFPSL